MLYRNQYAYWLVVDELDYEFEIPEISNDGEDPYYGIISKDKVKKFFEESDMKKVFTDLINNCLKDLNGTIPDEIVLTDGGIQSIPLYCIVQDVLEDANISKEKLPMGVDNLDAVANGNAIFAFYASHFGEEEVAVLLPEFCKSVKPLAVCSEKVKAPHLKELVNGPTCMWLNE